MQKQLFKENQTYKRWELTLLLGVLSVGLTYRFIEQNFINPIENGLSWVAFLSCMALMIGIMAYYTSLKLSVKVTEEFISFRYHPLQGKRYKIRWADVQDYQIERMSETAQWNGWNLHYGNEQVFTLNGRNGINIIMKNGEQYFIGARDIEGLEKAVGQVFP